MTGVSPDHLVALSWFETDHPITVDLVYADGGHARNLFKSALYAPNAQCWLHKDLAKIVLRAAHKLNEDFGWRLIIYDGLRPVEAQIAMHQTQTVKANPEWSLPGNGYLSLPGDGGHPRGMAVDVSIEGLDMGTQFDEMTPQSARDYSGFAKEVLDNRNHLEMAMGEAAAALHLPLLPLPSEWWDFRFPKSFSSIFDAIYDRDLPPFMRATETHDRAVPTEWQSRFDKACDDVLNAISS